jgi:hypothetical protein
MKREKLMSVFHIIFYFLINFRVFGVVHDEIKGFHQQAIINAGKFVLQLVHDTEIDAVGIVAGKAAEGVAVITLYLGITSIIDDITGEKILLFCIYYMI